MRGTIFAISRFSSCRGPDQHGVARRTTSDVNKIFNITAVEHDGQRGTVRDRRNYRPFDTKLIRACSDPSADRHFVELYLRSIFLLGDRAKAASKVLAGGGGETHNNWGAGSSRIGCRTDPAVRHATLQRSVKLGFDC